MTGDYAPVETDTYFSGHDTSSEPPAIVPLPSAHLLDFSLDVSDNRAMDLDTGEIHMISSWPDDNDA